MRVTYAINARLAGGGIGTTAYHAVYAIHKRGWLSRLIVSSSKTNEFGQSDVRSQGLIGRALKRIANYDSTNRLYALGDAIFDEWAARQIPDCDIFHGWNNHALSSLASARQHRAITIIERPGSHIRQTDQLIREESKRWGNKERREVPKTLSRCLREYDEADFIMVPSQYNVDSFIARGFDPSRLLLLPLAADTQHFKPNWDLPDRPFRVLFVGQVTVRKGIGYVLEAWKRAQLSNAELIVAGQIKDDAKTIVAQSHNDPSIKWLGFVGDPVPLYQSAHVFVLPAVDEGSALVTYEAMACGLASIVTHNAGSIVRDGVDGYIVSLGDSSAIAEKLAWLSSHPSERIAIGMAARRAVEPMTWNAYGDALLAHYSAVRRKLD